MLPGYDRCFVCPIISILCLRRKRNPKRQNYGFRLILFENGVRSSEDWILLVQSLGVRLRSGQGMGAGGRRQIMTRSVL
jgi:hypothetical protein